MNPIKPGTDKYPTSQRLNVSLAFANNKNRWQRAAFRINEVIEAIPRIKRDVPKDEALSVTKDEKRTATLKANNAYIKANSAFELPPVLVWNELILMDNAVRYEYLLDATMMDRTMMTIERILREDILSGSDFWTTRFFMNPYIQSSSEDGATDSIESAIRIVEGTSAEQSMSLINAQQQLSTPQYMDRLRLAHGRTFELMKGLTGDMKSQLRVTLTEGVARGVGIRDLKGMINKRLGIGMGRAERIARTEINNVYRTAYMDEAKELNETALKDDEWEIKQVHRSSLSPTTRHKHALRHGSIYTMQQQNTWWALDGNAINCLCSTLDVLVSRETGEVLQSKMVDRMVKQREQFTGVTAPKTKKVVKPKVKKKDNRKLSIPNTSTVDAINNIQSKFSNAQIFNVKTGDKEIMRRNMATFDQLSDEYNLSMPAEDFQALGINGNKIQPRVIGGRKVKAKRFGKGVGGVVVTNSARRQLSVNSAVIKSKERTLRDKDSIFTKYVGEDNADVSTMTHEFGHLIFTPGYSELKGQVELDDWFNYQFKGTAEYHAYRDNARKVTNNYNRLFDRENRQLTSKYRSKEITREEYEKKFYSIDKSIKSEVVEGNEDHFVSIYAYSNERELVAEAFADYKLSPNPAKISITIGEAIDKFMRKKK